MLIAIMSETFAKNNETKHIQSLKSHLQFVLDNWWRDPLKDRHRIRYLITAFNRDDDSQNPNTIEDIKANQEMLEELIHDNFEELNERIQAGQTKHAHISDEIIKSIRELAMKVEVSKDDQR